MNAPSEPLVVKDATHLATLKAYVDSVPAPLQDDDAEIILGSGEHRYRLVNRWAQMPEGWVFEDVAAVAVDEADRVIVFARGAHPVNIFDRDGKLLAHWGEGLFRRPHGVRCGPDGMLYCVDDGDHTVRKCTPDGRVLMTLGTPGVPTPYMSGRPFSRPTDVAFSPTGDIYVTDGYFNAHVHKFDAAGRHLLTWGGSGIGPGQFNIPHNIVCDEDGWVYVADRENHRIQIFDGNGRYETQWNMLHRPCCLCRMCTGKGFLVGELGPAMAHIRHAPNLGPRIRALSEKGEVIADIGELPAGHGADRFTAPHGLATASRGDIYVGEVAKSNWDSLYPGTPVPHGLRCLRKLVKIYGATD